MVSYASRGGSRDEPAAKVGMASIYGEVWRIGGTTSKTGDQLDDFLESRAARVETSGSARFHCVELVITEGGF